MNAIKNFLAGIEPFQGLPGAELERVSSLVQELKHPKGTSVFSEGDEATSVWILFKGRLEIFKYTSDGKPRAIETIQPKDLFGTLCRMGATGSSYPCTAIASVDSTSLRLQNAVFLDLFRRFPSVVTGICTLCSNRLNMMQELTSSTQEPVEKRIVRTLLQLFKRQGSVLPYTKRQIGELAATTVETTIRTLSKLQKKQLISSSRGQIVLKNIKQLENIIES